MLWKPFPCHRTVERSWIENKLMNNLENATLLLIQGFLREQFSNMNYWKLGPWGPANIQCETAVEQNFDSCWSPLLLVSKFGIWARGLSLMPYWLVLSICSFLILSDNLFVTKCGAARYEPRAFGIRWHILHNCEMYFSNNVHFLEENLTAFACTGFSDAPKRIFTGGFFAGCEVPCPNLKRVPYHCNNDVKSFTFLLMVQCLGLCYPSLHFWTYSRLKLAPKLDVYVVRTETNLTFIAENWLTEEYFYVSILSLIITIVSKAIENTNYSTISIAYSCQYDSIISLHWFKHTTTYRSCSTNSVEIFHIIFLNMRTVHFLTFK